METGATQAKAWSVAVQDSVEWQYEELGELVEQGISWTFVFCDGKRLAKGVCPGNSCETVMCGGRGMLRWARSDGPSGLGSSLSLGGNGRGWVQEGVKSEPDIQDLIS